MSIQVYGIPKCGTCKKAFKWLQDNGRTKSEVCSNPRVLVGFRDQEDVMKEKLGL